MGLLRIQIGAGANPRLPVIMAVRSTAEIAGTRRAYFLSNLFRASNFIFRLDGESTYTLEMRRYRPLLNFVSQGRGSLS
jgi:hypothetical protein